MQKTKHEIELASNKITPQNINFLQSIANAIAVCKITNRKSQECR